MSWVRSPLAAPPCTTDVPYVPVHISRLARELREKLCVLSHDVDLRDCGWLFDETPLAIIEGDLGEAFN